MRLNKSTFTVVWCIYFWSVFAIQLVPRIVGGTANIIMYFLVLFLMIYFNDFKVPKNAILALGLLLYVAINFIVLDEKNKINIIGLEMNYSSYKMIFWILGLLCGCLFLRWAEIKELKYFKKTYILIVLTNCLANLFILIFIDSSASKYAGKTSDGLILGTSDFDSVYATTIVVPIFLFLFLREKSKKRWKILAFDIIIMLYIVKASFFIAFLASMLGIVLMLVLQIQRKDIRKISIAFVIAVFIFLVFNTDVLYNGMLVLASKINNANFSSRLIELVGVLRDGKTADDAVVRLDIYAKMIDGFLKHPFLGCILTEQNLYTSYAGHSTILDMLCGYGLIVCIPLFCGFHKQMIWIREQLKYGQEAFSCCYYVFIFIALFNPVTNGYGMLATIITVPYVLLSASYSINKWSRFKT